MIWKLICFSSLRLFHEVKRFIVSLVRKVCIQYFNKIKLNFFAYDMFVFFFFIAYHRVQLLLSITQAPKCSRGGRPSGWDYTASLFVHKHSKIPHMCKTWWQGVMFVVAVATWYKPTGDPVQTCHWGNPPLACATVHHTATGKLSGTSRSTREGCVVERAVIFCCSVSIKHVGPAGQDRLAWLGSVPSAHL